MPEESTTEIAGSPETSESEEMYLLKIALAEEDGHRGALPLAVLSEVLGVSAASANEMIRKLAGRSLVEYEPYRGAELTDAGRRIALRVLRTRRLWAGFLADLLGMGPSEADALACRLEHVTPAHVADRLSALLGDPGAGPLGKPIPPGAEGPARAASRSLLDADAGEIVEIQAIEGSSEAVGFLDRHGIRPGARVEVVAKGPGGVLIDAGATADLAAALAASVRVVRI